MLLLLAVAGVGVFHTLVPDHWAPISLLGRQQGWSRKRVALSAAGAGLGHTLSTLLIGIVVWLAGVAFAARFGTLVSIASSLALIGFGAWMALSSLREIRAGNEPAIGAAPEQHDGSRKRLGLLLILGSSPMVEGIPAFFSAAKFGWPLLTAMSILFAISTIGTYVALCVLSSAALNRVRFGAVERYGEVLSGTLIALVGALFLIWPL